MRLNNINENKARNNNECTSDHKRRTELHQGINRISRDHNISKAFESNYIRLIRTCEKFRTPAKFRKLFFRSLRAHQERNLHGSLDFKGFLTKT